MTLVERINALVAVVAVQVKTKMVKPGGATGQVYAKKSNDDFDAEWKDFIGATQADIQRIEAQNWFL